MYLVRVKDDHDSNNGNMSDDIFGGGTIRASVITPERCCYITGILDAAKQLKLDLTQTAELALACNIEPKELDVPCVGKSRGKADAKTSGK